MKITEKWLRKQHACKEGIKFYEKLNETDLLKLTELLIRAGEIKWAQWLLWNVTWNKENRWSRYYNLIKPSRLTRRCYYKLRRFLKTIIGIKPITAEQSHNWFEKNGFIINKQSTYGSFGHYFRTDPLDDKIGQKIKWHYDDSTDCYFAKWQMWTGTKNKKQLKMYPISKRKDGIEWECETDNETFSAWYTEDAFHKMMEYIKKHSEDKFKMLRDYIEKKQKEKLQD